MNDHPSMECAIVPQFQIQELVKCERNFTSLLLSLDILISIVSNAWDIDQCDL